MNKFLATLLISLSLISFPSWSADFDKGLAAPQHRDFATALREWTQLAEEGDAVAQSIPGLVYIIGDGVTHGYKTVVKWDTLAAKQGISIAQLNLGLMYGTGQGVLQDYVHAHMWANIASSNRNENSCELRDSIAFLMTQSQLEKAKDLARECVA